MYDVNLFWIWVYPCSTAMMPECQIGENKYAAMEPWENHHTQTWAVNDSNNKAGSPITNRSTQIHHVSEYSVPLTHHLMTKQNEPYVQSLDDYLFLKQQELHDLQVELIALVDARSQKMASEINELENILLGYWKT